MATAGSEAEELRIEIRELKIRLKQKEEQLQKLQRNTPANEHQTSDDGCNELPRVYTSTHEPTPATPIVKQLDNESIARYSRQLILPELGPTGQKKLGSTAVLIVGAGGLGCPSSIYLSAAGIGKLGFVDYDEVEISNLHRQILHSEHKVQKPKSASAAATCNSLNSSVICVPYHLPLNSRNALDIIKDYDIVLDCTDNVATRYLLNDACVLAKKPLVSGSALRWEGQLTVYNYQDGPCYRCLYPKPPPPETVTNCSDGGVLGVVPGIIGCVQALEAIKIAAGIGSSYSQKMLLFDGLDGSFRTIKLRPKQGKCPVCGPNPSITELIDYEQFCGARATDKTKQLELLKEGERITVKEYKSLCDSAQQHILVDVRTPVELEICGLDNAMNIPMDKLDKSEVIEALRAQIHSIENKPVPVFVVCRQGNDSQKAVQTLQGHFQGQEVTVKDIKGGLLAWSKQVDHTFPRY